MVLQQNRKILVAALLASLAACQKTETPATSAATSLSATPAAAATKAAPAVVAKVAIADMNEDQLRQAALTAMSENRLYSPAGDNAIEYYIALRNKFPNDPNISGALIDLAPYTSIAVGQSLSRGEFDEAERMTALIQKIDANYPALPRLHQNIADAKDAFQKKQAQAVEAQSRLAQQQAAEQKAAQQNAAQQPPKAGQAATVAATPPPPKPVEESAPPKPVVIAPAPVPQTPPATTPAAVPAATELRLVNAPPPRYPADALRENISGEVLLELSIDTDGSVSSAKVVRSSPPRVFDCEALTAVKRWKFAPISEPTVTRRTINFKPN